MNIVRIKLLFVMLALVVLSTACHAGGLVRARDYWVNAGTGLKIGPASMPVPEAAIGVATATGGCVPIEVAFIEREIVVEVAGTVTKVLRSYFVAAPIDTSKGGAAPVLRVCVTSGTNIMDLYHVKRIARFDKGNGTWVYCWKFLVDP
jgi:hypothetical protein